MNILTTVRCAMVCGLVVLTGPGCSDSPEAPAPAPASAPAPGSAAERLVGRWEGQVTPEMSVNDGAPEAFSESMSMGYEFRKDGTMAMNLFGEPLPGTWKIASADGDRAVVEMTVEMPSPEFSYEEVTEDGKTTVKSQSSVTSEKQTQTFSITFEADDRIVIAPIETPSDRTVFTRQR